MAVVVRVEDLIRGAPQASDDMVEDLSDDPAVLGRLWCMILLMALRDHATSIQYHPWRAEGGLAYVVDGVRYALEPPPAELAGPFLAVARSLFTEPVSGGLFRRHRRSTRAGASCATVELDVGGDVFLWDAVAWSSGERFGVELFLVAPTLAQQIQTEPDAAAHGGCANSS